MLYLIDYALHHLACPPSVDWSFAVVFFVVVMATSMGDRRVHFLTAPLPVACCLFVRPLL